MGVSVSLAVYIDAKATKGIASRSGQDKTRHIAVHPVSAGVCARQGRFKVQNVRGDSEFITKHLASGDLKGHMARMGLEFQEGRAATAPQLTTSVMREAQQSKVRIMHANVMKSLQSRALHLVDEP